MKWSKATVLYREGVLKGVKNKLHSVCPMKQILVVLVLLHSAVLMACKCSTVSPINQELAKAYDVIFTGKVDSISSCSTDAIAYFTINALYKGKTTEQVAVHFDCTTSCMMSFAKNDEWIIYAIYGHFDLVSVNICSHSRKHFKTGEQDFYQTASGRSFEEENEFLKSSLGRQAFAEKENWNTEQKEFKPHNTQPSNSNKIYLLLISFGVMILIYILTRKKRKKNG